VRFYTYGAAGALLTVDKQAIATMRFRGPVTPRVLSQSLYDFADYATRRAVQAAVWRLEDTHMVCGFEGSVMPPEERSMVLRKIPAAVVVQEEHFAQAAAHVYRLTQSGMIRRAFLSYAPALDWARQKGLALQPFPPELPYFRETM
jgi:acyl-CoA reductase-like NAD-dependent aldehyde dehydrogenase